MNDSLTIIIILLILFVGFPIFWMGKDIYQMNCEVEEIEHWLEQGEYNDHT